MVTCLDCGAERNPSAKGWCKDRCKACYKRFWRAERSPRREGPPDPMLDPEPLLRLVSEDVQLSFRLWGPNAARGPWQKRLDRLRENERITLALADEFCVALGTHLALVWPDLYTDEEAARYPDEDVA